MRQPLEAAADAFSIGTFVVAVIFVAVYARRSWRSTAMGQNLMAMALLIALVSGLVTTRIIWTDWYEQWRPQLRAFLWAAGFCIMTWRLVLLIGTPPAVSHRCACTCRPPTPPPVTSGADR